MEPDADSLLGGIFIFHCFFLCALFLCLILWRAGSMLCWCCVLCVSVRKLSARMLWECESEWFIVKFSVCSVCVLISNVLWFSSLVMCIVLFVSQCVYDVCPISVCSIGVRSTLDLSCESMYKCPCHQFCISVWLLLYLFVINGIEAKYMTGSVWLLPWYQWDLKMTTLEKTAGGWRHRFKTLFQGAC